MQKLVALLVAQGLGVRLSVDGMARPTLFITLLTGQVFRLLEADAQIMSDLGTLNAAGIEALG